MMKYKVTLGNGFYWLETAEVEADSEEQALIEATKTIGWLVTNEERPDLFEELEADEENRSLDEWMYLDRSEAGLENGYLYIINSSIEALE